MNAPKQHADRKTHSVGKDRQAIHQAFRKQNLRRRKTTLGSPKTVRRCNGELAQGPGGPPCTTARDYRISACPSWYIRRSSHLQHISSPPTTTPVIFWYNYLCTVNLPHLRRWSFDGSCKLRNGYPRVAPRTSEAAFLLLILGFALGIIRIRMVRPAADLYRPTAYKRAG